MADNKGLRYSVGKPRYDLLPPDALEALADHFRKGAEKYAERNWERGMNYGECYRALQSHSQKFWRGEDVDEETGSLHTTAMVWNALALLTYQLRNIGVDDRAQVGRPEESPSPASTESLHSGPSRDTEVFAEGDPVPI